MMTARRHSYFAKHFPEQSRADKTLAGKSKRISNLGQVRKTKKNHQEVIGKIGERGSQEATFMAPQH